MLATHPPAKRTFSSAGDYYSNVEFDVNLSVSHNIPLLHHPYTQALGLSTITPPCKRGRPHHFADQWSGGGAATAEVQRELSAAAATSFSYAPLTFPPDYPTHVEANEEGCENEQTGCFLPNTSVSAPARNMRVKRTATSSDAVKDKSMDTSNVEDSRSSKLSSSNSNHNSWGVSSRRRPVPGENRPRLAANWRETTSSRGADNSYNVPSHVKTDDVTASMSNAPSSEIATDGLEFRGGFNVISGESSFAFAPAVDELLQRCHSDIETYHNMTAPTPYNGLNNIEHGSDFAHIQSHQFPDARSNIHTNDLFRPAIDMAFTSVPSQTNFAPNNCASMSPLPSSAFENSAYATMPPEYALNLHDDWGSGLNLKWSVDFNPATIMAPQARVYGDTSDTSKERENMPHDYFNTQWSFSPPEDNGNLSMESPSQNTVDDGFPNTSAFDSPTALSEGWIGSGRINEHHFPQSGASTSSSARMHRKLGRRPSQRHYNHKTVERHQLRRPGFPSPSLDTSDVSTGRFPFLESRTDLVSNDEITESTESSEVCYSSAESNDGNASHDLSRRNQLLAEVSAKSRPRASSRFSAKVSNLTNNTNDRSPVLVVVEDTNDTQQDVQEFLAKANQRSRSQKTRSSSYSPSRKVATTWEHTFVIQNEFTEASESPPGRGSRKLRGRTQPLSKDTKKRASEMRKIGSCLRCKISKIACTPGAICEPCLKAQSSFPGKICNRAHLTDYLNLFLPEQEVRPFQKAAIEQFMAKISGFSDSRFKVYVSSGPCYPSISVTVQPFRAKDESILFCKSITTDRASKKFAFLKSYSPPLRITDFNQDLRGKLTGHIRDIVEGERNYGEVIYGNTSKLTWDVYEAVRLYQRANPTNHLLRELLALYAMQFFITKSVVLLQDESENVLKHLPGPVELDSQNPDLRLINIQLKHEMYFLIRETYVDILEELEKGLLLKRPALWAQTFCCILILCMCAEMVQITSDFRVVNALDDMSKSPDGLDKNGNSASREDSIDVCRKLDDLPLASAESSFHLVYKMIKLKDGSKRERGFNPIRDGLDTVRKAKLGKDVEDFVSRIQAVMANHRNELKHEATIPSFNRSPDIIEDYKIFRMHNSGRLVSAFLQSMR